MQQNSRCILCGDRNKTINHITSECCKSAQREYKTRHVWVGKMIHRELCKKFKFDHTTKWYVQPRIHPRKFDGQNSLVILKESEKRDKY